MFTLPNLSKIGKISFVQHISYLHLAPLPFWHSNKGKIPCLHFFPFILFISLHLDTALVLDLIFTTVKYIFISLLVEGKQGIGHLVLAQLINIWKRTLTLLSNNVHESISKHHISCLNLIGLTGEWSY